MSILKIGEHSFDLTGSFLKLAGGFLLDFRYFAEQRPDFIQG